MKAMGKRSLASFLAGLLNVCWYLAALGLGVALIVVALVIFGATPRLEMTIPVTFTLDNAAHRVMSPSLGIDEAHVQGSPGIAFQYDPKEEGRSPSAGNFRIHGSLRFPAQKGAFLAANAAILIFFFGLLLWVLGQLRAIFRTLRDGQPFVPANATRLRQIAFAVIGGELARAAFAFFENYYAMTHFVAEGLRFDARPDLNVLAVLNGLIILVVAEVFRVGTHLDEEQSLTV